MRSGKSDKIKIDCRRPKKGDLQVKPYSTHT